MHCLEVIVKRNAYAAGREAGHAANDGNVDLHEDIREAEVPTAEFMDGYRAGRKEN